MASSADWVFDGVLVFSALAKVGTGRRVVNDQVIEGGGERQQ